MKPIHEYRSVFCLNSLGWLPGLALAALLATPGLRAADAPSKSKPVFDETPAQHNMLMQWWRQARFGMFIHWGIYSVPAHAEWYMNNGHIPRGKYEQYATQFDPVKFNADQWAQIAANAGMKYLVITSKHHDGFSMFDSAVTDYNVVKATPWGKDPLKALSAACRRHGIRFAVYYSIMDWHSPYQAAAHPDDTRPTYNPTHFVPGKKDDYIRYMKAQLKELVTQYHPAILWFDGGWMHGWTDADGQEIFRYLRSLDPLLVINNRARGSGDYGTPEQHIPANGLPGQDWETCMTINNSWGYNATDDHFKSARRLIRNLIDIASKGGNYLLNVGPTSLGQIPQPEVDRLEAMGAWLKTNGQAIYGTRPGPFTQQPAWGRVTAKGDRLYLEVFDWPSDGKLQLPAVPNHEVAAAFLLAHPHRSGVSVSQDSDSITVSVPAEAPDAVASVVVLELKPTAQ
jgi:alpha-L-fucosidase